MATPHDEEAPASGGAPPAEPARPQSSGGGGAAPQQALQQPQPPATDGEGEGAPTTPMATAPAVDSPALRAAVAAAAEPPHQNHLHITHEDYDWMGVLDTLEAHPDGGWGGAYHYHQCSSPRPSPVGHGPGHALQPQHPQGQGTAEAQAASLDASAAAIATEAAANNGEEAGTLSAAGAPATSGNGSNNTDARKQSRIEKKRHREKQRRLDTNAQFEALAEMVREIEAVDFAEEARFHSGGGGGAGAAIMGRANLTAPVHGAAVPGGPGAPAPPTLEGKSPEESPSEPKKLKTGDPPPTASFNPSNRVDLIARTISQLSRFRALRQRRNAELVEARRRECQLRKEADELRRTVAHYKAVGMGGMGGTGGTGGGMYPPKPPEKVMMMVPMMVPQDAVGRISSGYPAAHQYASASYGQAVAASPWMPTMPSPGGVPYQQPAAPPPAYGLGMHPSHPPASAASPAHLQPYSGNPSTAAPPAGESAMAGQQLQSLPPQGAHGPPPAPSYASAALHHSSGTHAPPPGMHAPQYAAAPPAAMAMYPQAPSVPGGMPTVAFGRHPHPPAAPQTAPAGPPPGMLAPAPPHGAGNPAGVQPALHQPQHTPPAGTLPQQLASDKPPAAPPGGGGNLAHCA